MLQPDNWGARARFGMFIVSSEAVPEAEWWAMLPPGVSVHAARVTAKAPWAAWAADRSRVELADDVRRGAAQFASMRLQAVVIGHSSSSFLGGVGWDEAVVAALETMLPADVSVSTNGLDCGAAMRAMEITRPLVVLPPWFNEAIVADGMGYLRGHGFEPAGCLQFDPGEPWNSIPRDQHYAHGLGFAQDVEALHGQVVDACPGDADGVFIAGTGFRCSAIIEALEQRLSRPVVAANQASLWRCLRAAGVTGGVAGYGGLLGGSGSL